MRRWHAEATLLRQRQLFYANNVSGAIDTERPLGRFRKLKPLDCGHTECRMCHGPKILGLKTEALRISDEFLAEQIEEFKQQGGVIVRL